jgi:hypothetical protein
MKIINDLEEIILNVSSYKFISDTEMKIELLYATVVPKFFILFILKFHLLNYIFHYLMLLTLFLVE